jgi:SAM-dependent methyltransferase
MPEKVDLYNSSYANYGLDVYRKVRVATYGEDFGQTSWVVTEESNEIPRLLQLTPASSVLEIGCGSGAYAVHLAEMVGCKVVGLDINLPGVQNANELAASRGLRSRACFEVCDASQSLPLENASCNAVFSNDAMCHIPNRPLLFAEIFRVLEPGGRLLFSDALVVGGVVSHEEIATRSSIGYYLYSPPGENERLLQQAGFSLLAVRDTTANAAAIAARWHVARGENRDALLAREGEAGFAGLQHFLAVVRKLTQERRLLRLLYLSQKI